MGTYNCDVLHSERQITILATPTMTKPVTSFQATGFLFFSFIGIGSAGGDLALA